MFCCVSTRCHKQPVLRFDDMLIFLYGKVCYIAVWVVTTGFYFIISLFIYEAGVEPSPLLLRPFIALLYQPWMIDGDDCGAVSGMNEWQGKPKYSEKTCFYSALFTTESIWPDQARCRTAAVGSRLLAAWATARPNCRLFEADWPVRTNAKEAIFQPVRSLELGCWGSIPGKSSHFYLCHCI
jgi:hypothetical protein